MKFEIIAGSKNDFLQNMEREVKSIISGYPHAFYISNCGIGRKYEIQSESNIFEHMKAQIMTRCISYLLYSIKMHYYKQRIKQFMSRDMHFIMLKVLVFSDFDKELNEILSKIINSNTISLDGVYNFLIKPFEYDWQRGVNVINLSIPELKIQSNFNEFIKSMSCTISSKYQILYLFCGLRSAVLSDKLEKVPSTYLDSENLSSEERIISTLIENYPMNVAIYEESTKQIVCDALNILFDVRKDSKTVRSV